MGSKHYPHWRNSRNRRRKDLARRTRKEELYEGPGFHYAWKAKGTKTEAEILLGDRDYVFERARRSKGWKSRRNRCQWERRCIAAEKCLRVRLARARREADARLPEE